MHTYEECLDVYDVDSHGNLGESSECLCAKLLRAVLQASGAGIAGSLHMLSELAACRLCQHERLHSRYTFQTQHHSKHSLHHTYPFLLCCLCVAVSVEFICDRHYSLVGVLLILILTHKPKRMRKVVYVHYSSYMLCVLMALPPSC